MIELSQIEFGEDCLLNLHCIGSTPISGFHLTKFARKKAKVSTMPLPVQYFTRMQSAEDPFPERMDRVNVAPL